jgi:Outer membrane protein beta-barrel domain
MNKKLFLSFIIVVLGVSAFSQKRVGGAQNLQRFDLRKYHFGFALSGNQSSFYLDYKPDFTFSDSLLAITNVPQAGFNLAILASYNPIPNINFRFVPGLSFQDRTLSYSFLKPNGKVDTQLKPVSSVWLEFPIITKFRTNRTNNFAAYALIGGKYAIDMQSQKDVDNNVAQQLVLKLTKTDYAVEAGGGFDFFLPYFKFGIEFKTSMGLKNVLLQENTRYSAPLEKLKTRAFVVSITFEG